MRLPFSLRVTALVFTLFALSSLTARADMRVWEAHADDPDKLQYFDLSGFVQPGYIRRLEDTQSRKLLTYNDSEFWLQRARVGFKAQLSKYFIVRLEMEASGSVALQDAYIESQIKPWFVLRAGQFQMAFLRTFQFNESNLGFIDHTLYVPQDQVRDALSYLKPRDIGFMITGRVGNLSPLSTSPVFEYWLGAFNGAGANHTDNPDSAYLYSLRMQLHVFGVPDGEAAESDIARNQKPKLAVAGALYMNCDDQLNVNRGVDVDAEFRWQGLFVSGSLVRFHDGPAGGAGSLDSAFGYSHCGAGAAQANHVAIGASVQAQYVLPKFLFPIGNQALELLTRWDYVDAYAPPDVSLGTGQGQPNYQPPTSFGDSQHPPASWRMTFGVNYFPTSRQTLRLSLNYQLNSIVEPVHRVDGSIVPSVANDVLWLQLTAGI